MLTAKHVMDDGTERIEEFASVYAKRDSKMTGNPLVIYGVTSVVTVPHTEFRAPGMLYVMNESGRTIGTYKVGDLMAPSYQYPPGPTAEELTAAVEKTQE